MIKEYDALLVATGSLPEHREIEGEKNKDNISFLSDINDHQKIRSYLDKKIKNVVINLLTTLIYKDHCWSQFILV